jgi:hypothetical protein
MDFYIEPGGGLNQLFLNHEHYVVAFGHAGSSSKNLVAEL